MTEKSIFEKIEEHKKNGSNILIPMTEIEHSDFHVPVIDSVTLTPATDAYKRQEDKFALSFGGLNKLGVCAGVQWHPHETRRTDDGRDKLYISFRAVGGVKKADGSMVWHAANYDLDLEIIKEELEEIHAANARKYKKDQAYIDFCVARDWRQKRRHKHALAESGAKARVLRSLLGVKNLYSMSELQKPFVVVRYVFRPPMNDPYVRRQLVDAAMSSMTGIYGPNTALPHFRAPEEEYIDIPPDTDNGDESPAGVDVDPPPDTTTEAAEPPPEAPAAPIDEQMWSSATKSEKQAEIRRLARVTGYDLPGFENRAGALNKLGEAKVNGLFKSLCDLYEKQQEGK